MTKITEMHHSSHPHQLILMSAETPYQCDGCKELGFGPCYQCNEQECNFHLHEQCVATSRSSTIHPFFEKTKFIFHDTFPRRCIGFCVACGNGVQGFRYQSFCPKAHVLHPSCLKLPLTLTDQAVSLRLKKARWFTIWRPSKCLKCQNRKISKEIEGWVYVSTCGDYCFHVACVKDLILDHWKKGHFHPQSHGENGNTLQLVVEHGDLTRRKARKICLSKLKVVLQLIIPPILSSMLEIVVTLIL